jgi:hypothetical protein
VTTGERWQGNSPSTFDNDTQDNAGGGSPARSHNGRASRRAPDTCRRMHPCEAERDLVALAERDCKCMDIKVMGAR